MPFMTDFVPSKRFGQNFIVDERIIDRIVAGCCLVKDDVVLEIGAGQGALTRKVFPLVSRLYAVETDTRLFEGLKAELKAGNLSLYHADILNFSLDAIVSYDRIKVIGNLPYNISTPIFEKMLLERKRAAAFFFTVQHEFALRITASPGSKEYSALTCFVNFFAVPKILFRISSRAFRPMPKVESCFLRIDFRHELPVSLKDEAGFFKLVRLAFLQRRKTIANAIHSLGSREDIAVWLDQVGIDNKLRPEDVTPVEYARLSNVIIKVPVKENQGRR
jgi:16S rRNA (adenine1518-N6/adenine1519-N6)-dimethyltransferase